MDPSILAAISDLKEKEAEQKVVIDLVDFDRNHRELKNELVLKREQVKKFQEELEAAHLKIHELKHSLDSAKKTIEEQEFKLNLAVQNGSYLEKKLYERRDFINAQNLERELTINEKDTLEKLLEQAELDKYNLNRKLESLQSEHQTDMAFQRELKNEDIKIRTAVEELKESLTKIESEHKKVLEISAEDRKHELLLKTLGFYKDEMLELKQSNRLLEEKYIVANAKSEKLEELLQTLRDENQSSLSFKEWHMCAEYQKSHLKLKDEMIESLTDALKLERKANEKLVVSDAENGILISELEERVKEYERVLKDAEAKSHKSYVGGN